MRPLRSLPALLLLLSLLAGCATGPEVSDGLPLADAGTPPADGPLPVEGDGGIGGPGDPMVTSNVVLDGDRVAVRDTCLEPNTGAATVYRLELEEGRLRLHRTAEGDRLEHRQGDTVAISDGTEPPAVTAGPGVVTVQGRVTTPAGAERFVDAVIGTRELPSCAPTDA